MVCRGGLAEKGPFASLGVEVLVGWLPSAWKNFGRSSPASGLGDGVDASTVLAPLMCLSPANLGCIRGLCDCGLIPFGFASLAWKNLGSVSGLAVLDTLSPRPSADINPVGYCTSLTTLWALVCRSGSPFAPNPLAVFGPPEVHSRASIIEVGLAIGGVLSGVILGVDEALSTLAFLDPDLGVILELMNAFTGVAPSPLFSAMCTLAPIT